MVASRAIGSDERRVKKKILMAPSNCYARGLLFLLAILAARPCSVLGETPEQLISAAKNEKELFFIAGPTTFGGKKGLAEIEAAFNKRFGLNARIRFSAGPEMNAMAARVISEFKAGGKASTDIYLGSLGQYANLFREDALEEVNWSGIFPWIARPMEEIVGKRGVLVYSSPRGIIYNSNLIAADKRRRVTRI